MKTVCAAKKGKCGTQDKRVQKRKTEKPSNTRRFCLKHRLILCAVLVADVCDCCSVRSKIHRKQHKMCELCSFIALKNTRFLKYKSGIYTTRKCNLHYKMYTQKCNFLTIFTPHVCV